jgi:short-subunit dehydrogenase
VLVNNAGYGLYGPVEQLPMGEIRRQFETNFFGLVRRDVAKVITQAVTARRPRPRYLINPVAKSLVALNQVLPARAYDAVLRRQYGLPS